MRPPAPTVIGCKHGRPFLTAIADELTCWCCGAEVRSRVVLCLACRAIPPLKSGLR